MHWLIVFRWLKFNFHNFPETGWWLNNTCSASLSSFLKIDFYSTTGTNKTAWLRIIFSIWKFSHSVSWKVFKFQVSWYFSNNLWNYRISFLKTNWVVTDHWPYEWFSAPGNKMIDIKINLVDQMPKWTVTCRNMVWVVWYVLVVCARIPCSRLFIIAKNFSKKMRQTIVRTWTNKTFLIK